MKVKNGYPHKKCSVSTSIGDFLTVGSGRLDFNGFWEYPCKECARVLEKHMNELVWPFEEVKIDG